MQSNSRVIEALFSALSKGEIANVTACYAPDARFEDIAFNLEGRDNIRQMWRLVCSRNVKFQLKSVEADGSQCQAKWIADYIFSDTGRRVVNPIRSTFLFRDGRIVDQLDQCSALAWAKQAYGFPKSLVAGLVTPLRRRAARKKLDAFIRDHPER